MKRPKLSAALESFQDYSDREAKQLLYRINVIGGICLLLVFGYLVVNHYETKLNYLFSSVEESIGQAIMRGDQHILDNIARSINQADDVDAVWVTENKRDDVVGFYSKTASRDSILSQNRRTFFDGALLKTNISHSISALGFGQVGTLHMLIEVPVIRLLSLGALLFGIFLFISLSFLTSFRKLAKKLSSPITHLAQKINSTEPKGFPDLDNHNHQFLEIQSVANSFQNLLQAKTESEIAAQASLSDAIKGRIASIVVHDVRQKLHNAFIMVEALKRRVGEKRELTQLHHALVSVDNTVSDIPKVDLGNLSHSSKQEVVKLSSEQNSDVRAYPVLALIEPVVREYRTKASIEGKNISIDIERSEFTLKIAVDALKFQRVIGNLLSNSFKAITGSGKIVISVSVEDGSVSIEVADTGHGCSEEQLQKIGTLGFTTFESAGTGTGLASSIASIEAWNGKIKFESEDGKGFTAKIALPQSDTDLYVDRISLAGKTEAVVVDDDSEIHKKWKERLATTRPDVKVRSFRSAAEFRNWYQSVDDMHARVFFFDLRLESEIDDGLSLAAIVPEQDPKWLVTSNWCDRETLNRCENQKLKILPKDLVEAVPIS